MSLRVFVIGATDTIGQATVRALLRHGHSLVCLVRQRSGVGGAMGSGGSGGSGDSTRLLQGATLRVGDVTDPASLERGGFCGEHFDALVSCLASRTDAPAGAWAIDHHAQLHAPAAAQQAGVRQMLVWDAQRACDDADATPPAGSQTLADFYAALLRGDARAERGDHAVV